MAWLDQLRPASWRGVPFQVDTIAVTAGDNVVLREYPFQDLPSVFRMGEGAEEIRFAAYVIGDDYDQQRDALRQALTGEGVLVHPTAGSIRCYVAGKYQIDEAPTAEGGMARFTLTFVRAEARRYPVGVANTAQDAGAKAATAKQAAKDAFAAQWKISKQPGWVAERAVERIRASVAAFSGPILAAAQQVQGFYSEVVGSYQALRDGLDDLVSAPRQLADGVASLFELPADLSTAAARDFQAAFAWAFSVKARITGTDFETVRQPDTGVLAMYGSGNAGALAVDSASRARLNAIMGVGDQLFESLATAAWVQATAAAELANYDDAMAMRTAVDTQCRRLLTEASAAAAADELPATSWHDAMLALHTAALADLLARSRDLVRLTTYTPEAWQPVWYISYRLYGTTQYADEILAMNPHIQHPLLVPPGRALRIVKHD